jgi:hypothetical protein
MKIKWSCFEENNAQIVVTFESPAISLTKYVSSFSNAKPSICGIP